MSFKRKFFVSALILSITFATATVTLSQGTEIELTAENSSIFMGQDFNFSEVTVYDSNVTFNSENFTITSDTSAEINTTLKDYNLSNPSEGKVLEVETKAASGSTVNYRAEANTTVSGEYQLYEDGSQIKTFNPGEVLKWSQGSWSNNHTYRVDYSTSKSVTLSWTDNSNNEDGFKIYSNATGTMAQRKTVGADTTSTTESTDLQSGETVKFKVASYNTFGTSSFSTATTTIS